MKKSICIIIMLILVIVAVFYQKIDTAILKKVYPIKYSDYVEKYSKEYNMDPLLIYAIIKVESNYNPKSKSKSNAIGLMQLINTTAEEQVKNLNIDYSGEKDLYDPKINIMIGTKYFSNLMEYYDNNYILAATAYNAGIGNVKKWMDEGIINQYGTDVENIPFKETNNYTRKIIKAYKVYKKLYQK